MNELYKYPNVVGHGLTHEEKKAVLVSRKLPLEMLAESNVVPREFKGQLTDVIEVGFVEAQQARTDRWRPAPPGVSIGHPKISAGTFGAVVIDNEIDVPLILSNSHVIANSGDAELYDNIIQPGDADGGNVEKDTIAALWRFHPIQFSEQPPACNLAKGFAGLTNLLARLIGSRHRVRAVQEQDNDGEVNYIDAAVAKPFNLKNITNEILDIGKPTGHIENVGLGMDVSKSGRTTGLTHGQVTVVNATIQVSYEGNRVAVFEDQIITTGMSAGGDSGSLGIILKDNEILAFGLLFAGSEQVTIYNRIENVLQELNIRF